MTSSFLNDSNDIYRLAFQVNSFNLVFLIQICKSLNKQYEESFDFIDSLILTNLELNSLNNNNNNNQEILTNDNNNDYENDINYYLIFDQNVLIYFNRLKNAIYKIVYTPIKITSKK
jgi:CRISPR/Cas system CMR subunit Cmr4 (Cas7 group RAMP superfamily)